MCRYFAIPRSLYYYKPVTPPKDQALRESIKQIFHQSRQTYGARKIQRQLQDRGIQVSRKKVRQLMDEEGLISVYQVAKYRLQKSTCNQAKTENIVGRSFDERKRLEVVVSDLTYVRVQGRWCYVCIILDLHNREVIGYSAGPRKTKDLVYEALLRISYPLNLIDIYHTDRGKEFDNQLIEQALQTFGITRSLSRPGNPYDNAVMEAFNKILKKEFVRGRTFESIHQLKLELFDYIHWYNNQRIHGSLGYVSPIEYKKMFA